MAESQMKIVLYGKTVVPENWCFHNNPSINKIYYIYSGTGYLSYFKNNEQQRFPLKKGHLYLLPSQVIYTPQHNPKDPIDHLFFNFHVVPPILLDTHIEYKVPEKSALYYIIKTCEAYLCQSKKTNHVSEKELGQLKKTNNVSEKENETINTLLDALFTLICQEFKVPRVADQRISIVLNYIHKNYLEDISVPKLANLVHLEQRQLLRIFKKSLNTSPIKYLREYRLIIAATLFRKGIALHEVADQLGYENQASFCYAFKKYHLISPTAYMEGMRW